VDDKPKTIQEEAGLPPNWQPIDSAPIIPGQPQGAPPSQSSFTAPGPYYSGSIPSSLQHDVQFVRAAGYPSPSSGDTVPLMPIALGSSASASAGIQTIVKSQGFVTPSSSPVTSVFGRTGSIVAMTGDFSFPQITGLVAVAQGGVGVNLSATGGTHQVLLQSTVGGNITVAQLAFTDISGTATTGQIPNLDASKITSGLLALARGGTNADLSGTGGTSQVLRQSTTGAAITVSQLAATDLSNGVTGTGAVVLDTTPTFITSLISPVVILTGATPTTTAGQVGLGVTTGFGNGTPATAVTTTTLGTGSGPATPQTVVGYLEIDIAGTKAWIPYVQ